MDEKTIRKRFREIRDGVNVIENTSLILQYISDLRLHAELDKNLQPSVRDILHKDANEIDKDLFFATEFFIRKSEDHDIQ